MILHIVITFDTTTFWALYLFFIKLRQTKNVDSYERIPPSFSIFIDP
jgi:hypothetical protein